MIKPNGDFALAQLRYRMPDAKMYVSEEPFSVGEITFPIGTIIIPVSPSNGNSLSIHKWESTLSELGLVETS